MIITSLLFFSNIHIIKSVYTRLFSESYELALIESLSKNMNTLFCVKESSTYYATKLDFGNITFTNLKNTFTVFLNADDEEFQKIFKSLFRKNNILYMYGHSHYLSDFISEMTELLSVKTYYTVFESYYSHTLIDFSFTGFDCVIVNKIFNLENSFKNLVFLNTVNLIVINIQFIVVNKLNNNYYQLQPDQDTVYVVENDNNNYNFIITNIKNISDFKNKTKLVLNDIFLIKMK